MRIFNNRHYCFCFTVLMFDYWQFYHLSQFNQSIKDGNLVYFGNIFILVMDLSINYAGFYLELVH